MRQKTLMMFENYVMEYSPADGKKTKWQELKPGVEVILVERYNVLTGLSRFEIFLYNGTGIPGNMNSNIKTYHGWRGTTNNIAKYAHGVRKIEMVKPVLDEHGWEKYCKVRVGKDLHPEWE